MVSRQQPALRAHATVLAGNVFSEITRDGRIFGKRPRSQSEAGRPPSACKAPSLLCQRVGAKRRPMTGSAKQSMWPQRKNGLLRRFAPRNDVAQTSNMTPPSRDVIRPRCAGIFRPEMKGVGATPSGERGMPGARCTRSRAWWVVNTRVSHHGRTGITRHSRTRWF